MVWWIVALLMALVLSPLVWLRPSRRQSGQMEARMAARRMGLAMQLSQQAWPHWQSPEPPSTCAQYHRQRRKGRTDAWSYWRSEGQWLNQWREPCSDAVLMAHLNDLPADVFKAEADGRMIALFWGERDPQALPRIAAALEALA
jgi:type II secretory pathway pseudopilin PulG